MLAQRHSMPATQITWQLPFPTALGVAQYNTVETADMCCTGPRGHAGVDNGRIWFSNVRVPRECLLNRYADVSTDGTYSSPIKSVSQRFGVCHS